VHPRIARHLGLKNPQGVLVLNVEPDSPAANAGLHEGDLLVGFNGKPMNSIEDLQRVLVGEEIGVTSAISVVRHTFQLQLEVTPTEKPESSNE
jgi:serine protease Do